jgi:hypothetical protein
VWAGLLVLVGGGRRGNRRKRKKIEGGRRWANLFGDGEDVAGRGVFGKERLRPH